MNGDARIAWAVTTKRSKGIVGTRCNFVVIKAGLCKDELLYVSFVSVCLEPNVGGKSICEFHCFFANFSK